MKRITACAILMTTLFGYNVSRAATPFQEGLWEMTMETTMEGLPMAVPPTTATVRHCVQGDDLVPKDPNARNCTFGKVKKSGNKVSWEYTCKQDGTTATGKGEMTYTGSTCSGTSRTVMTMDEGKMTAVTKLKGKRLGKCSGNEDPSMTVNGKDVNEMKARAQQAMAVAQQSEAQREAQRQRAKKLINELRIPKQKRDACDHFADLQFGDERDSSCDDRQPELALREGEWEVTRETARKTSYGGMVDYVPGTTTTEKVCLSPFHEPITSEKMKRSDNTVTWAQTRDYGSTSMEHQGGIEYRGDSFAGASIDKTVMGAAGNEEVYTRITGRRLGDGDCIGRDLTARKIRKARLTGSSRGSREESGSGGSGAIIDNPVRKLRGMFGF